MTKQAFLSLSAAAAAAFLLSGCRTGEGLSTNTDTRFAEEALAPYVEKGELPGAVSIFYDDGHLEVACVGYANVEAQRKITLDDVYMQCSQTKGFCGVTVAKLVEEGKLNLDDPVSKYLPEFKELWVEVSNTNGVRRLERAKNALTVRMCLNHTGGFPFEISAKAQDLPGGGWSGGATLRVTAAIAAASPLLFEPGTRVAYSNTGIDIGAAVVEVVTGMKWEDYLEKTVLNPLGMSATGFWPTDLQLETQVEMYECVSNAPAKYCLQNGWEQRPYNGSHVRPSAGAGLWTNARDQYRFYKMLMNLGVGDNGARILKAETVKSILATSTRPKGIRSWYWDGVEDGYSLGLGAPQAEKADDRESSWFGHGGAWGTNCQVNWKTRQLKLWAVQLVGGPRPWDAARADAATKFFKHASDSSSLNALTGRTK